MDRVKGGWKRRMPVVPSPRYESANRGCLLFRAFRSSASCLAIFFLRVPCVKCSFCVTSPSVTCSPFPWVETRENGGNRSKVAAVNSDVAWRFDGRCFRGCNSLGFYPIDRLFSIINDHGLLGAANGLPASASGRSLLFRCNLPSSVRLSSTTAKCCSLKTVK